MDRTTEILFNYLKNILYYPNQEKLDIDSLPLEFQKLGQGIQYLADCIQEEQEFTKALARGELCVEPPGKENMLAAPAKALQSSLRHLQWQTKQVAKGDYSQHVDFMGEFSEAFNTMTEQLSERSTRLQQEKSLVEAKNQELKQNLELMMALTNYTHNMIYVFSKETGKEIFANHPAQWFTMTHPEEAELLKEQLRKQQVEGEGNSINWETELDLVSGEDKIYYAIESFLITWHNELTVVHIVIDNTERKKQENFIYNLAYVDTLTGLSNRRYALSIMEGWLQAGTPFLISFVDVDYLKYCNDTYGHENGDLYLIDVANCLQTIHGDVCRIGGDEFLVLATGTDAEAMDRHLAHLRELFMEKADTPYPKCFSFATTAVPANPERSLNEYLQMTDEKMQQYKMKNKKPLSDAGYKDNRI